MPMPSPSNRANFTGVFCKFSSAVNDIITTDNVSVFIINNHQADNSLLVIIINHKIIIPILYYYSYISLR